MVQNNGTTFESKNPLDDIVAGPAFIKKQKLSHISQKDSVFNGQVYDKFLEQIGNTPLVDLSYLSANPEVKIYAKCEFMNPTMSIKDRIAKHIIADAEESGQLKPGDTIVAATSGNTGASIAMFASMKGYKPVIITNQKTSQEKQDIMKAYGAELIVGPAGVPSDSPDHYMNMASRMAEENGWYDVDQYNNLKNPEAYYKTLGPEIWAQTDQKVTHFVAAGSTGGTISGVGKYLKEVSDNKCKIVLADPHGSIFYDFWKDGVLSQPKSFLVEGVGKDSIPGAMDMSLVDDMVQVSDKESFHMCRKLSKEQGMLIGGSAGLNLSGAVQLSGKIEKGVIVTILCDSGAKYLSKIFNDEWMASKKLL